MRSPRELESQRVRGGFTVRLRGTTRPGGAVYEPDARFTSGFEFRSGRVQLCGLVRETHYYRDIGGTRSLGQPEHL
jgi:hypothetical protein